RFHSHEIRGVSSDLLPAMSAPAPGGIRPYATTLRARLALESAVNGHLFLPNRGHHFSPLVAMISPHWWPSNLPTIRAARA
ncbi:MAG: hypothetical protein M3065_04455, partial [Actinomycetota bacterium]|nr:hypothetical protein [Actinomycetota bacterium]